ncbi:MAG: hypothetical protein JW866_02945 [Ignavibacteriales bacterium]|nr:hypothetical protein [Ignavibacteriales bacterium]
MLRKSDPWYIHLILYVVIVILIYLLIKVAIVDPKETMAKENFFKKESRTRMENLRELQILWEKKNKAYTDDITKLVEFFKTEKEVQALINAVDTLGKVEVDVKDENGNVIGVRDSIATKSKNPFRTLLGDDPSKPETQIGPGDIEQWASLLVYSPKSKNPYIMKVDTTTESDTVIDRRGNVIKVNTNTVTGKRWMVECPDGYGKIGDVMQDALKNAASWE